MANDKKDKPNFSSKQDLSPRKKAAKAAIAAANNLNELKAAIAKYF